MQPIRILIITHAPLSAEFGAGQVAVNLAAALRLLGHDVTLWSPHPMPSQTRWWQNITGIQLMRSKVDEFIATVPPFDVIDCFATLITKNVSKSAKFIIARSVQPDILYIASKLNNPLKKKIKEIIILPFTYVYSLYQIALLLQGWSRAKYILCLGTLELEWMKKWFPWWKNKLISYINALANAEQEALAQIRLQRQKFEVESIRFLWIGRWVVQKGIDELSKFIAQRAASHPQDTFTIAGCGDNVENFSLELIDSARLKILPSFARNQLYSLLASHDVGLFTSRVEGWGLVLNEMLESGMPVCATSVGGVPDLQPFFPGMLIPFPPQNQLIPDTLANTDMKNYYKQFNWQTIAENYISYYINSK